MHYSVPMTAGMADGYKFPGEYMGQYGVYEAISHLYSKHPELKKLIKEESLYINKKYFSADLEKAIDVVKKEFREKH